MFSATHDITLREKHYSGGNFQDLRQFRIESGNKLLEDHFKKCTYTEKYTSVQVHNALIELRNNVVRKNIIAEVNCSDGFSILAEETSDLASVEQLSIGIILNLIVKEEFLGFIELKPMRLWKFVKSGI